MWKSTNECPPFACLVTKCHVLRYFVFKPLMNASIGIFEDLPALPVCQIIHSNHRICVTPNWYKWRWMLSRHVGSIMTVIGHSIMLGHSLLPTAEQHQAARTVHSPPRAGTKPQPQTMMVHFQPPEMPFVMWQWGKKPYYSIFKKVCNSCIYNNVESKWLRKVSKCRVNLYSADAHVPGAFIRSFSVW